jgi:hypothetical protein
LIPRQLHGNAGGKLLPGFGAGVPNLSCIRARPRCPGERAQRGCQRRHRADRRGVLLRVGPVGRIEDRQALPDHANQGTMRFRAGAHADAEHQIGSLQLAQHRRMAADAAIQT